MTSFERDAVGTAPVDADVVGTCSACRACGATQIDAARFCESCGADQLSRVWSIEVDVDRSRVAAARSVGVDFPHDRQPVAFEFESDRVVIGRGGDGHNPDLDLSHEFADPGVSHVHAVIERMSDAGWTVTDLGSTNGTAINDSDHAIQPGESFPLSSGDRILIGVWTVLRARFGDANAK
jgi:hypothetical protein